MAFPGKTSPEAILSAAIALLEREGGEALTLRRIAALLGVVPNALYRYYASREALIAAIADETARRLLAAIDAGLDESKGANAAGAEARVRTLINIYVAFSNAHPDLYQTLVGDKSGGEAAGLPQPLARERLWLKVIDVIEPLAGAQNAPLAAVTLWGLLHGMWTLRRANLFGGDMPAEIGAFAVDALLKGLAP